MEFNGQIYFPAAVPREKRTPYPFHSSLDSPQSQQGF